MYNIKQRCAHYVSHYVSLHRESVFTLCRENADSLHRYCPEHVESWQSCGDHHAWHLWVPVDLLDLWLALVQEQQLWGQVFQVLHPGAHIARLHWQIPQAYDVVCSRGSEHAWVCRAPFHGSDGGAVLLEVGHGPPSLRFKQKHLGVTVQSTAWCLITQIMLELFVSIVFELHQETNVESCALLAN